MIKAVALVATLLLPLAGQADDKDVLEYRQRIMKSLQEQTAAFGQILSGAGPTENTLAHMETLALSASVALKAFEAKVPGGEAKPEIWSNWPDFAKRMQEFADKTAGMARIGREQGVDAAVMEVLDALPCKACHDLYRDEKKK
ncbi:cytochrome c [Povalibacter sp.]|uniref:c-type cytochrome n=1 Tax=Povalibacter sp. TaxID=1962978 RepID=UPI002F408ED6